MPGTRLSAQDLNTKIFHSDCYTPIYGAASPGLPPALGKCGCGHTWHPGQAHQGSLLLNNHICCSTVEHLPFSVHPTPHGRGGPDAPRAHRAHSAFETSHLISTQPGNPSPLGTPPKTTLLPRSLSSPPLLPVLPSCIPVNTQYLNRLFMISVPAW